MALRLFEYCERRINAIGLEYIYIVWAFVLGTAVCFMTPPYQVPDGIAHFARVKQITDGVLISPTLTIQEIIDSDNIEIKKFINGIFNERGGAGCLSTDELNRQVMVSEVPTSMLREYSPYTDKQIRNHYYSWDRLKKFYLLPRDNKEPKELIFVHNTGVYAPFAYGPQVLAGFIASFLCLPWGCTYYFMCFSAMIFNIVCIFLSMKLLPEKRSLIFALSIMPMYLIEMTSVSADAVIYGMGILSCSWILSLRNRAVRLDNIQIGLFMGLSVILALVKPSYSTILLLYFVLPWQCMTNKLRFWGFGLLLLLVNLAVSKVWVDMCVYARGISLIYVDLLYTGVDAEAQKTYILNHLSDMFFILVRSLMNTETWVAKTFIGQITTNPNFYPGWLYGLYFMLLSLLSVGGKIKFNVKQRGGMLFIAILTITAIFLIEYITWTPVGNDIIRGVQGRYFIPIALLIFLPFSLNKYFRYENTFTLFVVLCSSIVTIWTTYAVFY